MKITKIISGLILIASSSVFGQNIQNATRNTDNEFFTEAEKEFRLLIAAEPLNASNYFYLGENFFAQKEIDSAIVYWNKASEKDPTNPLSSVASGKVKLIKGDVSGAKLVFTDVLTKTKNKNAEVIRMIAKAYLNSDFPNTTETIALLNQAVKVDPKNEFNFLLLGDAYLTSEPINPNEAIKNYNDVLDINPKSPRGLVRIGKLYTRVNSDSAANVNFGKAISIDPTYAPAYRENAELYLKYSNKANKAIENWKKYLELNNSQEARYRYITALYKGKQYTEVITEANNLIATGFSNFYLDRMLTFAYAENTSDKTNIDKGLTASDVFFKKVPEDKINFLDYKYRGQLLQAANKDSLAVVEYEKAIAIDESKKADILPVIAKAYLKSKKYQKGIDVLEEKLKSSGLTSAEYFDLGKAYFFGPKKYVLADSAFTKVIAKSPTFTSGYYWKARSIYFGNLNDKTFAAKPFYEKTFEMIKPEERTVAANKSMVLESCKYLGDYYFNSTSKDLEKAKSFFAIVQEIDPADAQAKAFFSKVK
jgi:tetratricopeptide (TPR) repeat protein